MGMRVIAIDGGDEKQELCTKLGAEAFIDFQKTKDITAEVMKITTYGVHGVIVTAASKPAYDQAVALLRPKGTVVVVGLPKDATIIAGAVPMVMAMKQLKVVGSVVGSLNDVKEALDLTARDLVHVSSFPILLAGSQTDTLLANPDQGQIGGSGRLRQENGCRSTCWSCRFEGCRINQGLSGHPVIIYYCS